MENSRSAGPHRPQACRAWAVPTPGEAGRPGQHPAEAGRGWGIRRHSKAGHLLRYFPAWTIPCLVGGERSVRPSHADDAGLVSPTTRGWNVPSGMSPSTTCGSSPEPAAWAPGSLGDASRIPKYEIPLASLSHRLQRGVRVLLGPRSPGLPTATHCIQFTQQLRRLPRGTRWAGPRDTPTVG